MNDYTREAVSVGPLRYSDAAPLDHCRREREGTDATATATAEQKAAAELAAEELLAQEAAEVAEAAEAAKAAKAAKAAEAAKAVEAAKVAKAAEWERAANAARVAEAAKVAKAPEVAQVAEAKAEVAKARAAAEAAAESTTAELLAEEDPSEVTAGKNQKKKKKKKKGDGAASPLEEKLTEEGKMAEKARNPVNEDEQHSQEGWSVVEAKPRASPREGRSPATLQPRVQPLTSPIRAPAIKPTSCHSSPQPASGTSRTAGSLLTISQQSRTVSRTVPKTLQALLWLHQLVPWEKPLKHYLWATQLSVLELHSRLSLQREALLEQVNELWKEHDEQTKNANASLKEDAHAARLCAATGLRQLAMNRNGNCAYLCAARWWIAVAKGAPYPGKGEDGRAESGGGKYGQEEEEEEVARGAAAMRTAVAARLRALLAANVPAVLSEVDGEINDLTKTAPSRRTATGELLCALLQSDPLCCAIMDAESEAAAAQAAAAREHYVTTMETPAIFAERLQIKLLADVLRAPVHLHYSVDLSPEGEGKGEGKSEGKGEGKGEDEEGLDAIKKPCEVIQPNELCCAGGNIAVEANGDGEDLDLDETARRPPLRLLHLITAKVNGEESQTHLQPLSCFSPLCAPVNCTALSPLLPTFFPPTAALRPALAERADDITRLTKFVERSQLIRIRNAGS